MQWRGTELGRSERFADVQQAVIERRLYGRIMRVLPETVEIAADITAHLARLRRRLLT